MTPEQLGRFRSISSNQDLAEFLDMPLKDLTMLAYGKVIRYRLFLIPRKNSDNARKIEAPNPYLRRVQNRLAEIFSCIYNPPNSSHGFISGRSIVSNAKKHLRKKAILNMDLKDFFPSIKAGRIRGLFLSTVFNFPEEVANTLTNLVCLDQHLPQGAPTSPILSNFICYSMDKELTLYAKENNLTYSRYADDICLSSHSAAAIRRLCAINDDNIVTVNEDVTNIIKRNGFTLNANKTHIAFSSSRQTVTGVIVNKKCNFPREDYRSLRVLFHNWKKHGGCMAAEEYAKAEPEYASRVFDENGPSEEMLKKHIRGRLDFYHMITTGNDEPSTPLIRLWMMYRDITGEKVPEIFPSEAVTLTTCSYDYRISKSGSKLFCANGTAFLSSDNLLITCAHCLKPSGIEPPAEARCLMTPSLGLSRASLERFKFYSNLDIAYRALDGSHQGLLLDRAYIPQIGEHVKAFGFAADGSILRQLEATVTEIFQNKSRARVDRPFIHGMSGGPVLNKHNRVIGIIVGGSKPDSYTVDGEFILISSLIDVLPC